MKILHGTSWGAFLFLGALLVGGCNTQRVAELQEEVDRLNVIKMNYEKEVQDLMGRIEGQKVANLQIQEEVKGKQREIDLLMEKLRTVKPTQRVMSDEKYRMLRLIAQEIGGELVGNRILLPSDFFFRSGSWALQENAKQTLKQIADVLEPEQMRLVLMIVGHTDNEPIKKLKKKGIKSNRELSLKRAMAVLDYLTRYCNYPSELLYPTGWGELKPIASNSTPQGRRQNRRVEIYIDPDLSNLIKQSAITDVAPGGDGAGGASMGGIKAVPAPANPRKPAVRFTK
jgi:chemotaxis protein MotB